MLQSETSASEEQSIIMPVGKLVLSAQDLERTWLDQQPISMRRSLHIWLR